MEYFSKQIEEFIEAPMADLSFSTDNKAVNKDLKDQIKKFNILLKIKEFCFKGLNAKFDSHKYMQLRNNAVFANIKEPKAVKKEVKASVNTKLFDLLRSFRTDISDMEDIPPFQIFTQDTLHEMCDKLPSNSAQLLKIKGMGKIRVSKYGEEILDIINDYCERENIGSREAFSKEKDKTKKVHKKGETQQMSFEMFKCGLSVDEIAKKRELKSTTIETHLAMFIKDGSIKLSEILGEKKSKEIVSAITEVEYPDLGLTELKEKLNDKYSWGELRMALSAIELS